MISCTNHGCSWKKEKTKLKAAVCYKCGTDLKLDDDTLATLSASAAAPAPGTNAEALSQAAGPGSSQGPTGNHAAAVLPIRSVPTPAPWHKDRARKRIEVAQQEYQAVLAESLTEITMCGSISESTQHAITVLKAEITALGNGAAAPSRTSWETTPNSRLCKRRRPDWENWSKKPPPQCRMRRRNAFTDSLPSSMKYEPTSTSSKPARSVFSYETKNRLHGSPKQRLHRSSSLHGGRRCGPSC